MQSSHDWYAAPSDFWGRLTPDAREHLERMGARARFRKQDMVFRAGGDGNAAYVLMSGRIKIYTLSSAGRAVTLWICLPGEVFGLAEMARLGQRIVYAEACADSEVLILSCERLRAHLASDAATAMLAIDMLSCRLRQLTDALLNMIADDVNTRVAKLLLRLQARHGRALDDGGVQLEIALTHQEMADMIGTTRQSVSGALTYFRNQGLLSARGRHLRLPDPDRLASLALAVRSKTCQEMATGSGPDQERGLEA